MESCASYFCISLADLPPNHVDKNPINDIFMCEAKHRPDPQLSTGTIKIQLMIATRFIANHRDDMALRLIDVELRSDNMLMKENIYLDIERSPDLGIEAVRTLPDALPTTKMSNN